MIAYAQYRVTIRICSTTYPSTVVRVPKITWTDSGLPKEGATNADLVYAAINAMLNPLYPTPEALRDNLHIKNGQVFQCRKVVPMSLCKAVSVTLLAPMDPFAVLENVAAG